MMMRLGRNGGLSLHQFLVACTLILPCGGQMSWYLNKVGNSLKHLPGTRVVFCKMYECCTEDWITNNTTELELQLDDRLYGQHLVKRAVLNHIKGHVGSSKHHPPSKALVFSFHGPQGTGKNHVSRIIAKALFKKGLDSEHVHLVSVPAVFTHVHKVTEYKDFLKNLIETNVKNCARSMFIFDDVDKMPRGLIDTIKPYLDYHHQLDGVDYRHAIFLFLSNSGSTAINQYVLKQLSDGRVRDEIKLKEMEAILTKAAINSEGLWHSELIGSHLVTAFLPFLPLERKHITRCIRDAMLTQKYYHHDSNISPEVVQEVMEELEFYPKDQPWFSVTGCKRVVEKVHYVMQS